jgi:hypothetical protein
MCGVTDRAWHCNETCCHCLQGSRSKTSGMEVVKVKVNFSLEQAMKAQRVNRGIAVLFI